MDFTVMLKTVLRTIVNLAHVQADLHVIKLMWSVLVDPLVLTMVILLFAQIVLKEAPVLDVIHAKKTILVILLA